MEYTGKNAALLKFSLLSLVLGRMVQDALDELINVKGFPKLSKIDVREIINKFVRQRKRIKQNLTPLQLRTLETTYCDITDSLENYTDRQKAIIKEDLVHNIKYKDIDAAVLIVFISHCLVCLQHVSVRLTGKKGIYGESIELLRDIDKAIGYQRLNKNIVPDYTASYNAMADTFKAVDKVLSEKFERKEIAV